MRVFDSSIDFHQHTEDRGYPAIDMEVGQSIDFIENIFDDGDVLGHRKSGLRGAGLVVFDTDTLELEFIAGDDFYLARITFGAGGQFTSGDGVGGLALLALELGRDALEVNGCLGGDGVFANDGPVELDGFVDD